MKYEYVEIAYKTRNVVIGYIDDHRQIIDMYARKGYRYVGMIPIEENTNGCIRKIDLVFEKDD